MTVAVVRTPERLERLVLHAPSEEGLARVARQAAEVVALGAVRADAADLGEEFGAMLDRVRRRYQGRVHPAVGDRVVLPLAL